MGFLLLRGWNPYAGGSQAAAKPSNAMLASRSESEHLIFRTLLELLGCVLKCLTE